MKFWYLLQMQAAKGSGEPCNFTRALAACTHNKGMYTCLDKQKILA